MANKFDRLPIVGGDDNSWGDFLLALIKDTIGGYKSYLFDDAGTLKISAGRIGISDGTNIGIATIEETARALTGTTGIWQKIEMSVSGAAVTFHATDLAGETDPAVLPAAFTGGYDDSKQGYYMIGTRRTLGVVWVDSGGTLAGIVNSKDGNLGYIGRAWLDTGQTAEIFWDVSIFNYNKRVEYNPSTWDMDTNATFNITHNLGSEKTKIKGGHFYIEQNGGAQLIYIFGNYNPGGAAGGSGIKEISSTNIVLTRENGSVFDAASFNAAIVKGEIFLEE